MCKYRNKKKAMENAIASTHCTHQNFLEEMFMEYEQRFVNLS